MRVIDILAREALLVEKSGKLDDEIIKLLNFDSGGFLEYIGFERFLLQFYKL